MGEKQLMNLIVTAAAIEVAINLFELEFTAIIIAVNLEKSSQLNLLQVP